MDNNLSTFSRFIYLNSYAFLLLFAGIGIAFMPCYQVHWSLVVLQIIVVLCFLYYSNQIFSHWKGKKKHYKKLMEQNEQELDVESFSEYMQAPCGRLLVRVVLTDLGKRQEYGYIKKQVNPTFKDMMKALSDACRPKETKVYVNIDGKLEKLK